MRATVSSTSRCEVVTMSQTYPIQDHKVRAYRGELVRVRYTFCGSTTETAGVVERHDTYHVWVAGRKFRRLDGQQVGGGEDAWQIVC